MKLTISQSKNSKTYYYAESYRTKEGKSTTRTLGKLGTYAELQERLGPDVDIDEWARAEVRRMTAEKRAGEPTMISVDLPANTPYTEDEDRCLNAGYLLLQKELYSLGFKKLVEAISTKYSFKYDLEKILADLIYSRVLEPASKRSSLEFCRDHLLEKPNYKLHDVYRALDVFQNESALIQSTLYKNSMKLGGIKRDSSVVFYDCTNFYFEISEEDDLRKYGHSKENRPNPIVQMGMFIDRSGFPLGFDLFPGNQNEQLSLQPIEQRLLKDYGLKDSRLIVCTDAGLASQNNRNFNAINNRDFITILPLRKMKGNDQDWCLDHGRSLIRDPMQPDENPERLKTLIENTCWRCDGDPKRGYFSIDDIDADDPENYERIFYKERYVVNPKTKVEERVIVTYSLKYRDFMKHKREVDVKRAEKLIAAKNLKKIDVKSSNDIRRYIKAAHTTKDGQEATQNSFSIDQAAVAAESRFDGFYAVCTSITKTDMPVSEIIAINHGRWEIEESFRLMKSEFRSRPVYLSMEARIKAHFVVCFMALLVFRLLEHRVNTVAEKIITAPRLIDTLRSMNVNPLDKNCYSGVFKRTEVTDVLHKLVRVRFDCRLITAGQMEKALKASKRLVSPKIPK